MQEYVNAWSGAERLVVSWGKMLCAAPRKKIYEICWQMNLKA